MFLIGLFIGIAFVIAVMAFGGYVDDGDDK